MAVFFSTHLKLLKFLFNKKEIIDQTPEVKYIKH